MLNPTYLPGGVADSLNELRADSFRRIAVLISIVCYVSITWALWPRNTSDARSLIALVSCSLLAITVVTDQLRQRLLRTASLALVAATFTSIAVLMFGLRSSSVMSTFTIPTIFAGVLLGYRSILVFAAAGIVCSLIFGQVYNTNELLLLSVALQAMTAVAVLQSSRNLYTALSWTLNALDVAIRNQNIARDRKAELEQAVKSLDIATQTLHRTNRALEGARNQAEEARQLKQHFAQTISHELRTPLNLIVGFAETMIHSPEYYGISLPPAYMRDLMIVYRNACHLQSLVNDVLDLARIESYQMGLQLVETNLSTIIDEAIKTAQGLVEKRGLAFFSYVESTLPAVWLDPVRVKQIIFNLLNNAARYTDSGSVSLRVWQQHDKVVFSVTDTGPGIASEDLKRIFEPFQQLGDPMRRPNGGVGLGLTISQRLARLHGGHIHAESQPGAGSTFSLYLPIRTREALVQPSSEFAVKHHPVSSARRVRQKLVLVVTRSLYGASMVTRHLPMCRTLIIQDYEQAKITAQQMHPEAVILDSSEQYLDSARLREIAAEWGLSSTSLIAVPLPGEEVLRSTLNVASFLIKPVSHDYLWDNLRQFGETVSEIMIVDDDHDFVRLVERMLDSPLKRYRLSQAFSGREALELMQQRVPDLILLDLEMSDMNGYDVIRHMRAAPELKNVRIIVVSGQEDWEVSNDLPGNLTMLKPAGATPNEVLQWLCHLLEEEKVTAAY